MTKKKPAPGGVGTVARKATAGAVAAAPAARGGAWSRFEAVLRADYPDDRSYLLALCAANPRNLGWRRLAELLRAALDDPLVQASPAKDATELFLELVADATLADSADEVWNRLYSTMQSIRTQPDRTREAQLRRGKASKTAVATAFQELSPHLQGRHAASAIQKKLKMRIPPLDLGKKRINELLVEKGLRPPPPKRK